MATKSTNWYESIASLMIQDKISFKQALTVQKIAIPSDEAEKIERSGAFRKILESARQKENQAVAENPDRNKAALIGEMIGYIRELAREGEWDKALEGAMKVAKLEGWAGAESNVNIFAGLSQKDIDNARKRLNGGKG